MAHNQPQGFVFHKPMTLCKLCLMTFSCVLWLYVSCSALGKTWHKTTVHKGLSFTNPWLYVSCGLGKTWNKTKQRLSFRKPCMTQWTLQDVSFARFVFQRAIMMHDSVKMYPEQDMAQTDWSQRFDFHKTMSICKPRWRHKISLKDRSPTSFRKP